MKPGHSQLLKLGVIAALVCASLSAFGQDKSQRRRSDPVDDVIRVATELVQSDVTVVDKQNHFVDGLDADEFELLVGGKKQPIVFFERVAAGSVAEQKQLAAARPASTLAESKDKPPPAPAERGRVIFFFVDDEHLTLENVTRTRQALLQFVDGEMLPTDLVAIVSPSGRIGFLQQLTGNKTVVREAISRLTDKRKTETYSGKVPISDYDADQVAHGHNHELFQYLVEATVAEFQGDPLIAANMVRNRVAQIEAQSRAATTDTLRVLERLLRSSAPLPGRKIVFFISGGFVTDPRASSVFERLHRITNAAADVGAVIYTMDARGTFANIYTDASLNPYPDFTGHVSRNVFAEGQATQESLHTLAEDSGGRAFLGSNSLVYGVRQALTESSNYYLLAWRPARDEDRKGKTRFIVSIKGRPDLRVRQRRGFINLNEAKAGGDVIADSKLQSADAQLLAALGALYPVTALPISLAVGYVNVPGKGPMLKAAMQIDLAALPEASTAHELDVIGIALDDRGSLSSFKQKLTVNPTEVLATGQHAVLWNQELSLPAGLYQVRVAVRDKESGRSGSAMQWLEIPGTAPGALALSSIFIGKRSDSASVTDKVQINVTRRFERASLLRYQAFVYNLALSKGEVVVQSRILRAAQAVSVLPARTVSSKDSSENAVSISGEIDLKDLTAGWYVLEMLATDNKTGRRVLQNVDFSISD
jgi:VWFA-related protein